ncbi:MAG TPA: endonuclease/exonuclease/phosphatase family protein [Casimicrobiaceae bacterium]|nr:endonuclease/exonuclease/phosphatase family protein [Casimicrobiaceae bacterium]
MSAEASASRPIVIATWNVHGGVGRDRRYHPARIAQVVVEMRADVIALQEVGSRASAENLLAVLVRETGYHVADGFTLKRDGCDFGNAVLSRFPIAESSRLDLTHKGYEPRGAVDVVIGAPQGPLRVIATHLGLRPSERRDQVKRLLAALERDQPFPTVLTGDVNEWYLWGRPLRWLHRHFQQTPAPPTFPAWRPVFALDRLWTEPARLLSELKVHATPLARAASDHLPLVAKLAF